jgi:hypothetical protein
MSPAKEISRDTLKLLATTIAEPIKANVNDDIYERVVELIALAFDEAQIKRIPDPAMVDVITDGIIGPFRDEISPDDFALLRGRFHRSFTGYTASDRN